MASKVCLCLAMFIALATLNVTAMTNFEFFELIRPNIADIDIVSTDEDLSDNVIELPGGPNDDLDVEYILQQLGLTYLKDGTPHIADPSKLRSASCHCSSNTCSCCLSHTFKVNVVFKKIKVKFNACVDVSYLTQNKGFEIKIQFNGKQMYHKEISITNPPELCYGVPGLKGFARVCVELYDVNLSAKSMCIRLKGVIDIKVHKFKVNLKLGCIRIPVLDRGNLLWMTRAKAVKEAADEKMEKASQDLLNFIEDLQDME